MPSETKAERVYVETENAGEVKGSRQLLPGALGGTAGIRARAGAWRAPTSWLPADADALPWGGMPLTFLSVFKLLRVVG